MLRLAFTRTPQLSAPSASAARPGVPRTVLACACLLALLTLPATAARAASTSAFTPAAGSPLTTGTDPSSLALADINRDGKPDLIVANSGSDSVGSVFLGKGNGTFTATAGLQLTAGSGPFAVAVADLNGDGLPDLIVTDGGAGMVSVFNGNGNGTFASQVEYATGNDPAGVAVGNLGNGHPDLVIANEGDSTVTVLLNDGNGNFTPAPGSPFPTGAGAAPKGVALGDFSGNGRLDIATADSGTDSVSVLPGNGDGTFGAPQSVSLPVGSQPSALAVGDLNGDGKPDLAVADAGTSQVSVLLGTGNHAFAPSVQYATGTTPDAIAIADLNDDGKPDLVTANSGANANSASILLGKGNGTFAAKQDLTAGIGTDPSSVAVADVNGDGKPDLAVANNGDGTASVLLNASTPTADLTGTISPFGLQLFGTKSAAQKVTLTNNGSAALTINSVTATGSFTASGCSGSLAPGAKCSLSVVFAPKGYGPLSGTVTVATNAPTNPKAISLSGFGVPPAATVTTAPVSDNAEDYATLNGSVLSQGPGTFEFQYGPTTAYGTQTPALADASSSSLQPFAATIPVNPGAVYHYRIVASNLVGTVNGADQVFTTPPDAPEVGSAVGRTPLAGVLKAGIPLLLRLTSDGTITVQVFIPVSVAVADRVISHRLPGLKRVWIGSARIEVRANTAEEVRLSVARRAARLLGRRSQLTLTVDARATAYGVGGDLTETTVALKRKPKISRS